MSNNAANRPAMLRWAGVMAWIEPLGVKASEFRKMIRAKVIAEIKLHPKARPYYSTKQIHAIIVAPLEAVEKTLKQP